MRHRFGSSVVLLNEHNPYLITDKGHKMNTLLSMFKGGSVKRYHTVEMIKEQTVAAHSWGVAVILCHIVKNPSAQLLKAALYHDVAEHIIGDMPATTKWRFKELAQAMSEAEQLTELELGIDIRLDEMDKAYLKFADMAELIITCVREYRLGNKDAADIVRRGLTYLEDRSWGKEPREYLEMLKTYVKENINER